MIKLRSLPLYVSMCVLAGAFLFSIPSQGQGVAPAVRIVNRIDESQLVTLSGNTNLHANARNDRGPVSPSLPMTDLILVLSRDPAQQAAFDAYVASEYDQNSPNFHQWLTPDQVGTEFGPSETDIQTITNWLTGHGFTVSQVTKDRMSIRFNGTAAQVESAFHTQIHNLLVKGVPHIGNMSDPQIPAALAPAVAGIVSLHNFHPKPLLLPHHDYTYTNTSGTFHALAPGDIATIYNFAPLFAAGLSGQGQSIMVVEDTYLYSTADWVTFRNTFGLQSYASGSLSQISPQGELKCKNPGFQGDPKDPGYGDDGEAAIDVEWASAAAPSASILLAACTDTSTTFGGLIALENVLNGPANGLPSVVSISYGEAEAVNGAASNAAYNSAYEQGVAEGVSIFVSAGDEDAASADDGSVATHGIGVSAFTSTPYNVSVGGRDFGYTADGVSPGIYWNSTNSPTYASARSYIQEIPWNDSCAGELVAGYLGTTALGLCNNSEVTSSTGTLNFLLNAIGGSGGPSGCATGRPSVPGVVSGSCAGYAKPDFQRGLLGNPADGVRDIPDVALFASNGFWDAYYVVCWSNPNTNVGGGFSCTGAPSTWAGFGGTSVSSPIMAAMQALVNQKTKSRWGNPNPTYYALAGAEYNSGAGTALCNSNTVNKRNNPCIFYDITQGDNVGACQASHRTLNNCYLQAGDAYGILSISDKTDESAYPTNTGWDFATGIGSVNAWNLVMGWPSSPEF